MSAISAIPAKYIQFCKDVAKLAQAAELQSVAVTLRPNFRAEWNDPIQLHWEQGRHGEDRGKLVVTSTVTVRADVQDMPV